MEKWALNGQHFSYLGAGIGGSITGKGGTVLIVDDPLKSAEEALNEGHLEKVWRWYTGTFLSRVSAPGGEPLEIVNMTRWAKGDICGKLLAGPDAGQWYVIKMEAYDKERDTMLCPDLLSKKRYDFLSGTMLEAIFRANYHQEPVDIQGRLYSHFMTYTDIPKDANGNPVFTRIINYTDTADEGKDYLASFCAGIYNGEAYILDVLYTKAPMEVTEPATADMLVRNGVNVATIESNNGGRGFSRNVQRIIWDKHKTRRVVINWFHQSQNKMARILSHSAFVQQHIYFPVNWRDRWPELYLALTSFLKEGKNLNDDAPDALTGLAEQIDKRIMSTTASKPKGW